MKVFDLGNRGYRVGGDCAFTNHRLYTLEEKYMNFQQLENIFDPTTGVY